MIRYETLDLSVTSSQMLAGYQAEVDAEVSFNRRVEVAVSQFKTRNNRSNPVFLEIREALEAMCFGVVRCMYCEDSYADEIEHHHPKTLYPERVFDWENYLYACGPCNGPKGNSFAVIGPQGVVIEVVRKQHRKASHTPPPIGRSAIIDPRTENPMSYLELDLRGNFLFAPLSDDETSLSYARAIQTIKTLGLNARSGLSRSRAEAFGSYCARLHQYGAKRDQRASAEDLGHLKNAMLRMQHPTVWIEMCRQYDRIPALRALFRQIPEALEWDPSEHRKRASGSSS